MRRQRSDTPVGGGLGPRLTAIAVGGWLTGPLLLAVVVSPAVVAVAQRSLIVHHLAHWLMVAAGAFLGYRLRSLPVSRRAWMAWAGLGAVLAWHLPPVLDRAEALPAAHVAAHATLIAGGFAIGSVVPCLSGSGKGALFLAAAAAMWPLILAEVAGLTYAGYPGQAPAAGVAELLAMSLTWPLMAAWVRLRRTAARPAMAVGAQGLLGLAAVVAWVASA